MGQVRGKRFQVRRGQFGAHPSVEIDFGAASVLGPKKVFDQLFRSEQLPPIIADIEGAPDIEPPHIAEAINYRSLDREG